MRNYTIIILLTLGIPTSAHNGLSFPYFIYPQNGDYILKSIAYSSQMVDSIGKTEVLFKTDSTIYYTINRYFNPDGIILGSNGKNLCYFLDNTYRFPEIDKDILLFYKNGVEYKKYTISELIDLDSKSDSYLLSYFNDSIYKWTNHKKQYNPEVDTFLILANEHPYFQINDTIYIITRDLDVLTFNIQNGDKLSKYKLHDIDINCFTRITDDIIVVPEHKFPGTFKMPTLSNGESYDSALAKSLGMKSYGIYVPNDGLKHYHLDVTALINSSGKCEEVSVDFDDKLIEDTIIDFFLNTQFDTNAVSKIIEKWYFHHGSSFRKEDIKIAKKEGRLERKKEIQEYKERIKKDSINNVYIPENMQDCINQLDLILTEKVKKEFMVADPIDYHFGLGQWIHNNWGLWSGSRLKVYFESKGIKHPDDMSGEILDCYHRYLNGKQIDEKYNKK